MSIFSFDELMGSLQAHEARLNRSQGKSEEKTFQVKGEENKKDMSTSRGHGRGDFRGRGRGRGHFQGQERRSMGEQNGTRMLSNALIAKSFGHVKVAVGIKQIMWKKKIKKVSSLWLIFILTKFQVMFGLLIVGARII